MSRTHYCPDTYLSLHVFQPLCLFSFTRLLCAHHSAASTHLPHLRPITSASLSSHLVSLWIFACSHPEAFVTVPFTWFCLFCLGAASPSPQSDSSFTLWSALATLLPPACKFREVGCSHFVPALLNKIQHNSGLFSF